MKTNTQIKRNKRSYIIIALIVVLLLSAVGYAAFQANLTITGTATGTATWDVHFKSTSTGGDSAPVISTDGKSITFTSTLGFPGDAQELTAVIENSGTLDAKLTGFTVSDGTNNVASKTYGTETASDPAILIQYETLSTTTGSEDIVGKNGGLCTYKFVVFWNKEYNTVGTNGAASTGTKTFTITLNYEQSTTAPTPSTDHQHTAGA